MFKISQLCQTSFSKFTANPALGIQIWLRRSQGLSMAAHKSRVCTVTGYSVKNHFRVRQAEDAGMFLGTFSSVWSSLSVCDLRWCVPEQQLNLVAPSCAQQKHNKTWTSERTEKRQNKPLTPLTPHVRVTSASLASQLWDSSQIFSLAQELRASLLVASCYW